MLRRFSAWSSMAGVGLVSPLIRAIRSRPILSAIENTDRASSLTAPSKEEIR